jgi:hypothetical protein
MKNITIPDPVPFKSAVPGPQRYSDPLPFLEFVGRILGNISGTLEIAQAISHAKQAIKKAVDSGLGACEISDHDLQVLVAVCKQRQMHMFDFEQLESFFAAITEAGDQK